jgi:hypothetical protein
MPWSPFCCNPPFHFHHRELLHSHQQTSKGESSHHQTFSMTFKDSIWKGDILFNKNAKKKLSSHDTISWKFIAFISLAT